MDKGTDLPFQKYRASIDKTSIKRFGCYLHALLSHTKIIILLRVSYQTIRRLLVDLQT